jgi:hypothetical protein
VTPRIAVHDHDRHRGVAAPVERLLAALVRPEVCGERSTQVVVELNRRRIVRFAVGGSGSPWVAAVRRGWQRFAVGGSGSP